MKLDYLMVLCHYCLQRGYSADVFGAVDLLVTPSSNSLWFELVEDFGSSTDRDPLFETEVVVSPSSNLVY